MEAVLRRSARCGVEASRRLRGPQPGRKLVFMGVIDVLQSFDVAKWFESTYKVGFSQCSYFYWS